MANAATTQKDEGINEISNKIDQLLSESPETREKVVEILKEIKNVDKEASIRDISRNSRLGKAMESLGGGLKYMSIDAAIMEFQKKGEQINESKIDEKKINEDKQKTRNEEKRKNESQNLELKEVRRKDEESKREKSEREMAAKKKALAQKIAKELGGDEKLEKIIEDELGKNIESREIKSSKDKKNDLVKKISRTTNKLPDTQMEMAAKEIIEGSGKLEVENIEEVRKKRNESFKKDFEDEIRRLNPNINQEQLQLVREQATIIADVYYGDKGIEDNRDSILSSGEITEGAYSDVEGVINLLQRSGGEIKDIQKRYQEIKEKLSDLKNMPDKLREFKSFDGIMGVLGKDSDLLDQFNFGQNRFLVWADRINKLTGGWLNRTFVNLAGKFVQKIGNESIKAFAENGLRMIAEQGFKKGVAAMFNAFLSGAAKKGVAAGIKIGLQAAAKVGGGMMAKAGAAAAAGPYGWIAALIIIAIEIGKKLKKIFTNIARRFGVSLDIKDKLQREYGKFGGWLLNKGYEGVKNFILPIVIISAIIYLIFGQQQGASQVVSPTDIAEDESSGEDETDYTEVITAGNISVPKCNTSIHDRRILKEISLSIENKVRYNRAATWVAIGPHPKWGQKSSGDYPYYGLDCAKFVSWVWLQCLGLDRSGELGSSYNLESMARRGVNGWKLVYPTSIDELKIGDVFYRTRSCYKNNKWQKCNHVVLYIGKDENGNGLTIESNRQQNNPHQEKITSIRVGEIFLSSGGRAYTEVMRKSGVFSNEED